jgi:hypothetical protein
MITAMSLPDDDKQSLYIAYAEHCLKLVRSVGERESRVVLREMAADWLNLAGREAGPLRASG